MPNLNTLMAQPLRPVTVPGIPKLHNRRPTLRRSPTTKFAPLALACAMMIMALAACAPGDFRVRHGALRNQFADYVAVANATGRGALATPLVRLVDVVWEYEALPASGADADLKASTLAAMRATVEAFEQFSMADADDESWREYWDASLEAWAAVNDLEAIFARDEG